MSAPFRAWWKAFLRVWNGITMMSLFNELPNDITVTLDASGSGAVNPSLGIMWLHASTVELRGPIQIDNHKGATSHHRCMYHVGEKMEGGCMQSYCDNQAVVAIIQSRYSRDNELMYLLHCLFYSKPFMDSRLQPRMYQVLIAY